MSQKIFTGFLILGVVSGVLCQVSGGDQKDVNHTASGRAMVFDDLKGCVQLKSLSCFLDVSEDIVAREKRSILAEADRALVLRGRSDGDEEESETPSQLTDTIGQLMDELTDIVKDSIVGFFRDGKDDDEEDEKETTTAVSEKDGSEEVEDGEDEDESARKLAARGHKKKKKIHKLIALIKLLILGAVIAVKLIVLLKIFAAHLQIKFLLIAFAGLVINAARFYFDLKKGHHPQKVIYYEHAQHQHHYEGAEDDWSSGPSENYWGRSYEDEEGQSAHDLAYAHQKPHGHKKKEEGFSWWG